MAAINFYRRMTLRMFTDKNDKIIKSFFKTADNKKKFYIFKKSCSAL